MSREETMSESVSPTTPSAHATPSTRANSSDRAKARRLNANKIAAKRARDRASARRPSQIVKSRGIPQRVARVGTALGIAVSVAACSAGMSRFDFPAFNLGSDGGQAPSGYAGSASQNTAPYPKYSYNSGDRRYSNGPARETSVRKTYAQKAPSSRDFEVASIDRQRVARQELAPAQGLNNNSYGKPRNLNSVEYGSKPSAGSLPVTGRTRPNVKVPLTAADRSCAIADNAGTVSVRQGDTLYGIARCNGVDVAALRAANGIADNSIRIGQRLALPGGRVARNSAPTRRLDVARKSVSPNQPLAAREPVIAPVPAPMIAAQPKPQKSVKVASADPRSDLTANNNFRWPVRGRILAKFGTKSDGSHNDGVNLAVPRGTEIRAAESGVVAYAGSELKAYGKLILVRHAGGWVSAYAHNDEIKVKRGDKIRRGQVISKAGTTGSVTQPQLHFELRKGSSPVDPQKYIPGL